jgi:hypothetical protein
MHTRNVPELRDPGFQLQILASSSAGDRTGSLVSPAGSKPRCCSYHGVGIATSEMANRYGHATPPFSS